MAISIADGFQYFGNKPLDSRIKYATLADLKAVSEANLYDGCEAYVTATKKYYSFDSSNSVDPTLGKWRERTSGGGGGGVTDYSDLTGKPSIDGVTLDGAMTAEDLGLAKEEDIPDVPTKTSDLNNDSGFITNVVNDLVNYYLKSETYSKTETDALIAAIKNSRFAVVSVLPTEDIKTNVIYLVPKADAETGDVKDEYINLDGTSAGWEKIGSTSVDLSGYVTDSDLATALNDYVAKADMSTYLADYALSEDVHSIPEGGTAGQVLKKKTATDYDVEWADEEGGGSGDSIVNGYIYRQPFVATTAMDYIKWIRNHTDKEIKVSSESIFNNKTANCFYMVLAPSAGYFLFSEYAFALEINYLRRDGNYIYNSSRYTLDGTSHVGFNSNGTFTYTNGITQCNQLTIGVSSEVDCSSLVDNSKSAQIYVTPNVYIANNTTYANNVVTIQNDLVFYSDSAHTSVITPASGTIYVDIPTGDMYEWNGTEYVQIGSQDVPTKTSDLINDSGFITKAVNDLTNYPTKTEVNTSLSRKQDTIQLSTMPTASAEYADNKIVQFIGTTTSTYVHGYFYECRESNDTYSWVQTDVQPSGGAGGGHSIEDSEGTSLTQRDTMQFGDGLNATDDSENEKTVVEPNLMTAADMDDVVTPLPSVQSRYHKYSTDEQIVGEWIDGKTLYEKTIVNTMPSNVVDDTDTSKFVDIGVSVDICMIINGFIISNNNILMPFDYVYMVGEKPYHVNASVVNNEYTANPNKIQVSTNRASFSDSPFYITIQYTKAD